MKRKLFNKKYFACELFNHVKDEITYYVEDIFKNVQGKNFLVYYNVQKLDW